MNTPSQPTRKEALDAAKRLKLLQRRFVLNDKAESDAPVRSPHEFKKSAQSR